MSDAASGNNGETRISRMRDKMGLNNTNPILLAVAVLLWSALFVSFLAGTFWVLAGIVERLAVRNTLKPSDLRWSLLALTAVTAALGAVITLPFTLIRLELNRRQIETAEQQTKTVLEGHITDRINKAVEGLGATKLTKTVYETPRYQKKDGEWLRDDDGNPVPALRPDGQEIIDREIVETSEPNLEVRIGAIYALERIAQDSDRDHVQIMEILCAYIRQNAPAREAKDWPKIEMKESEDFGPLDEDWDERVAEFREEQNKLNAEVACRNDIQVALEVIGRRNAHQRQLEALAGQGAANDTFVFDLPCLDPNEYLPKIGYSPEAIWAYKTKLEERHTILRSYRGYRLDLRNTDLQGSDLSKLNLNGALFDNAQLQRAQFEEAQLQGANLMKAELQGANLRRARLQGAHLYLAQFQGANLNGAQLQGAILLEAQLQGAFLDYVQLQGTRLVEVQFQGASLSETQMQGAHVKQVQLQRALLKGTQLQGAELEGAHLNKAKLFGTRLQGAFLRLEQLPGVSLEEVFGDGSVLLSDGRGPDHADWPAHWPKFDLKTNFEKEKRKWQVDPKGYVPPEPPDDDG